MRSLLGSKDPMAIAIAIPILILVLRSSRGDEIKIGIATGFPFKEIVGNGAIGSTVGSCLSAIDRAADVIVAGFSLGYATDLRDERTD